MNKMAKQLDVTQAERLLSKLRVMYGEDLNVRIIVSLPPEGTVSEMIPALKSEGFASHPEASSYAEREIVVTSEINGHP